MNAVPLIDAVELSGLSTGFCASTSEDPLKVWLSPTAMPASPSKASMPTRVSTVPDDGVKNGAMFVEKVVPFWTVPRPS